MSDSKHTKVDFDEYAEQYESLLVNQLSFFSGEREYFSSYKIEILKRLLGDQPKHILDFGCGIGLSVPHLLKEFPQAEVCATDISRASLGYVQRNHPGARVLADEYIDTKRFDLILVATVMHHVEPRLRRGLIERLEKMLAPGGSICIFEHNPYNPVTQRMVATCPFDEDAVLLTKKEAVGLLTHTGSLKVTHGGYTLFFPPALSALARLEGALRWMPLGGQYYVIATKQDA